MKPFYKYLEGLEFEPTAGLFWKRHRDKIITLQDQYLEENETMACDLTTPHIKFAIIRYLSGFKKYHEDNGLHIRSALHGFVHSHDKMLGPLKGTVKEFIQHNKIPLQAIYTKFRDLYYIERTRNLDTLFNYGVEDYMLAEGLLE